MADDAPHFAFGDNWKHFVADHFSEERVSIAQKHMLSFLGRNDLKGKTFLDIGCGSGLHSLAAFDAGAAKIVSFDVDPDSVHTTESLRARRGDPKNWTILQGSVLDKEFLAQLAPADIVYSWGVLHHTGDMWNAVANAATLMVPGGVFYLALYTTTQQSPSYLRIKKRYNRATPLLKRAMEFRHVVRHTVLTGLLAGTNPFRTIREYKKLRGMSYMVDVRDWLGGYPYEDARVEEVLRFCRRKLRLELIDLATGGANNEYLLQHTAATAAALASPVTAPAATLSAPAPANRGLKFVTKTSWAGLPLPTSRTRDLQPTGRIPPVKQVPHDIFDF